MGRLEKTYISKDANIRLKEYLETEGRNVQLVATEGIVDRYISNHADVFLCKMGWDDSAPIFYATASDLGPYYPQDSAFNAACTGKYFIHNLSITAPALLKSAEELGMTMVNVSQGYTKCNVAIVDENSIITSDPSIIRACADFPELDVLEIEPGHIRLDGYSTGFIGGTCGRIENTMVFNGNISVHPDFAKIVDFIEARNLSIKWFPEYQLTDIGSIL